MRSVVRILASFVLIAGCGELSADLGVSSAPQLDPGIKTYLLSQSGTTVGAAWAGLISTGATVGTAEHDLGTIAVDAEGKTLYVFIPDNAGDSTCYDDCATAWPPLIAKAAPTAGTGATAGLTGEGAAPRRASRR